MESADIKILLVDSEIVDDELSAIFKSVFLVKHLIIVVVTIDKAVGSGVDPLSLLEALHQQPHAVVEAGEPVGVNMAVFDVCEAGLNEDFLHHVLEMLCLKVSEKGVSLDLFRVAPEVGHGTA